MSTAFGALMAALMALTLSQPATAQGVIGVGTMSQGTLSFSTGSVIAQMMVEKLGLQARVQPNSGETTLIPLVNAGEIDFGVANVLEAVEAFEGRGAFERRPMDNLRVAAALFPLRVALFVRADSAIASVADLRGKRVTAGFPAMASITAMLDAVLATGGLSGADVTPVLVPNVVVGADHFVDGRADAFFFAVGAATVAEVNAATKVRILPVGDDAAAVARMRAIFPEAYVVTADPAPGLVGVTAATPVMAFDNLLLAGAQVPDAVVRRVVGGLAAHKAALVEGFPLFRGLDPQRLLKSGLRAPFHPATIAWAAAR